MDENKSITYDDLIQTRNTKILKSIVPFLDVPTQKPLAMLIHQLDQHGGLFSACRYQTAGCNA